MNGTIAVAALAEGGGNKGKHIIFKNCPPVTDCISEMNNAQVDNAKDIDIVMLMYKYRI